MRQQRRSIEWLEKIEALKPGDRCEFHYPARNEWLPGIVVRNGGSGYWEITDDSRGRSRGGLANVYIEGVRLPAQGEAWNPITTPRPLVAAIGHVANTRDVTATAGKLGRCRTVTCGRALTMVCSSCGGVARDGTREDDFCDPARRAAGTRCDGRYTVIHA